ncbi:hypothetical protein CANCADRAFT_20988 [Tortispora caseinolytica NRRL Y-17796]|uniref:L-2-hydroxyglutarate dehydrogenase, mitochondrial n=1 Tax=Tortispora caseinolytica NRRL Y-17796 TaxID=767744 RepID=A0A1E4TJE2_9ASCO|nr:hypothetical protein CANCADRAFT_20988 [Tortispora caseinolytica NRRL Y-17796]
MSKDFSHVIVGAGVVGLAIGARLSALHGSRVLLIEKYASPGTQTSARNSEVIHAGLYYPPTSLKSKLCIRGKQLLYETCAANSIDFKNCGKLVVAQTALEESKLNDLLIQTRDLGVPTSMVSLSQLKNIEPNVHAIAALESPSTGIVSAHGLMDFLQGRIADANADIALGTTVTKVEKESDGFRVHAETSDNETIDISTTFLINAAGHGAPSVSNSLLPPDRHVKQYYAKGNYYSYSGPAPTKRLIYPVPSGHAGLGTHLTLDLGGQAKFGPDVEWVDSDQDFALHNDPQHLKETLKEINRYLPQVQLNQLHPSYAGIRPKLVPAGAGFQDFIIQQEQGFPGFVNLLGIESPGLTSSLAIAEYVEALLG